MEKLGQDTTASDVEDLFEPSVYLDYFNKTYAKQLEGKQIKLADLPKGDRIVHRIERALAEKDIKVRPSGGFNHYSVAAMFVSSPPTKLDDATAARFSALFDAINNNFKK